MSRSLLQLGFLPLYSFSFQHGEFALSEMQARTPARIVLWHTVPNYIIDIIVSLTLEERCVLVYLMIPTQTHRENAMILKNERK